MDAGGTVVTGQKFDSAVLLRACAVGTSLGSGILLAGLTVLAITRRFDGSLTTSLSPFALLAVGGLLAALAAGARCWLFVERPVPLRDGKYRVLRGAAHAAPAVAIGLTAAAVVLPGSSTLGTVALVSMLLAGEAASCSRYASQRRQRQPGPLSAPIRATVPPSLRFDAPEVPVPHMLPEDLSQRIERGRSDDDQDICHGRVRSRFQEGQRTETIHLSFCPPFLTTPKLHLEQLDGPEAVIKSTQVLPYGARLEVRLAKSSSQPVQTVIGFSAIAD